MTVLLSVSVLPLKFNPDKASKNKADCKDTKAFLLRRWVWKLPGVPSALIPEGQLKETVPRSGWSDFPWGHTSANWRWLTNEQAFRGKFSKSFPGTPAYSTQQNIHSTSRWIIVCIEKDLMAEECHNITWLCSSSHQSMGRCLSTLLAATHTLPAWLTISPAGGQDFHSLAKIPTDKRIY